MTHLRQIRLYFVALAMTTTFCSQSFAQLITFTDAAVGGSFTAFSSYSEDGFTLDMPVLSGGLANLGFVGQRNGSDDDVLGVFNLEDDSTASFRLMRSDGGAFNLNSVTLLTTTNSTPGGSLTFTSGAISQTIDAPSLMTGHSTIGLTGFNGVTSVTVTGSTAATSGFRTMDIDSISVTAVAAVPEPSSFLLIGCLGLIGAGRSWFRSRQAMA